MRSGFFNSVNGDRKYNASSFAEYFSSFIANGVFPNPSDSLQVMPNNDMTITIKAGKAWIDGYILINDSDYNIDIDVADGLLNRIDRVVARLDTTDREIRVEIKKGSFASEPVASTLQRDADAYEIALADIYIAKGIVSISQANITDLRLNTELCGIVKGLIDEIDTTTIFNQYQAWLNDKNEELDTWFDITTTSFENNFNAWFISLQDILDENTAGNLLNEINTKANIDSPALTGLPTAPTQVSSDNSTKIATTAFVKGITNLLARIDSATDLFFGSTVDGSKILTTENYGNMYPTDITTSMALIVGMADKNVNVNSSSAVALTVDVGVFTRGQIINFERSGIGTVTFTAGAGFTLNSAPDSTKRSIKDRYTGVTLKFNSATNATLIGSLE